MNNTPSGITKSQAEDIYENHFFNSMAPTPFTQHQRNEIFRILKEIICETLSKLIYKYIYIYIYIQHALRTFYISYPLSLLQLLLGEYGNILHVQKYGSDPLRTYLPDSDIDITLLFMPYYDEQGYGWSLGDEDVYYIFNTLGNRFMQMSRWNKLISEVIMVNAEVKVIKLKYETMPIDISIQQVLFINTYYIQL